MRHLLPPIAAAFLVAACSASDNAGPTTLPGAEATLDQTATSWEAIVAIAGPGAMPIKVYAQNVYPGFDIDKVEAALGGPPEAALGALTNALLVFDVTSWRERAARMALAISKQESDVVVLNELVTVRREGFQAVSAFLEGTPFEPFAPHWAQIPDANVDFLPVCQEELAKLGRQHDLVATLPLTNIRIKLPYCPVPVFIQYDDRDAMFVRNDVRVGDVAVDTFAVTLQSVSLQSRGWIAADVEVHGTPRRHRGRPQPAAGQRRACPAGYGGLRRSLGAAQRPLAGRVHLLPRRRRDAARPGRRAREADRLHPGAAGVGLCDRPRAVQHLRRQPLRADGDGHVAVGSRGAVHGTGTAEGAHQLARAAPYCNHRGRDLPAPLLGGIIA
jgi:hypothetical protein